MGLIRKAILGAVASLIIYQTLHYLLFDAYAVWRFAPTRETIANKRVLVTGSSKGIGRELVELYSELGAHVTLHGRSEAALIEVSKECLKRGAASVNIAVGDMSKVGDAEKVVRSAADAMGGLDIVIVNHITPQKFLNLHSTIRLTQNGDLQSALQVNLLSYAEATMAAVPVLEGSSGSIVLVSSVLDRLPIPYFYPYIFAKRALEGLAISLNQELLLNGSTVHVGLAILGLVDTDNSKMATSAVSTEELYFAPVRQAAIGIASVAEGRLRQLVSPWSSKTFILLHKIFPELVEKQFRKTVRQL